MHTQTQNDAESVMQPGAERLEELLYDTTARTESHYYPDSGIVTAYPGSSIERSVFNALYNQSKNTVFIWDISDGPNFTLRYANPAFLRLLGKTPQDVFGKVFEEVIEKDTRGLMRSRFAECARRQCEVEFVHEEFGCMLITRLCPQVEAGRTVRLVGTNTDITVYMREQGQLKTVNEQLRQQGLLLNARIKFESLISNALREFMDAGSAGFDGSLYGINREFGMLMGADRSFILQRYSENLCVHKARWSREDGWPCEGIGRIGSIFGSRSGLAQINRLLVINDTRYDRLSQFSPSLLQYGVRALLAVPICSDAHFFGLLCLSQAERPRIWTTAEISMAKTVADTIMSAYLRTRLEFGLHENVRVLTEYDEALQDLLTKKEMLAEVSGNFLRAGAPGFDECAFKAIKEIGRLLGLDGMRMIFCGKDGINVVGWQLSGLHHIGQKCDRFSHAALHAATLNSSVAIDDTAEAKSPPELISAAIKEGLRSLLVVPLSGGDGVYGALTGFKAIGVKPWSPADISAMEAFAPVISDAYRQKRILEMQAKGNPAKNPAI